MKTSFPKYLLGVAIATASLLLIPLIAMQFTDEVNWSGFDFVFAGTFLFGTGAAYGWITRILDNQFYRLATGAALFSGLLLVWTNGAVGLIGSENEDFNMIYLAVIGVGIVGAGLSGFKPKGLSYTLFAMAASMVIIGIIALIMGMQHIPYSSTMEIIGVTLFFTVLYSFAGLLYGHAAKSVEQKAEAEAS